MEIELTYEGLETRRSFSFEHEQFGNIDVNYYVTDGEESWDFYSDKQDEFSDEEVEEFKQELIAHIEENYI